MLVWLPVPMDLMHLTLLSVHIIHQNKSYGIIHNHITLNMVNLPHMRCQEREEFESIWLNCNSYKYRFKIQFATTFSDNALFIWRSMALQWWLLSNDRSPHINTPFRACYGRDGIVPDGSKSYLVVTLMTQIVITLISSKYYLCTYSYVDL